MFKFLVYFFIFISLPLKAKLNIPSGLSSEDQSVFLETVGFGTQFKVNSDNYPKGGYAGFEAGLTYVLIPVEEISRLGNTSSSQNYFSYPIINVAKGLYKNIDLFLHFMPFSRGTGLSEYGGLIRWGFYQTPYAPMSFSFSIAANSINLNNQVVITNFSYDLVIGMTSQNIYMYLGAGYASTQGDFSGSGAEGVTLSGLNETSRKNSPHFLSGFGYTIDPIFLNLQIDYFENPSYSFKLGFNY